MRTTLVAGTVATLAAVGILVLGAPLAAQAHVKISPNTAAPGDDIQLTFRVPNEMENAGTVKVEIDLPTATPFAGADYEPVPGWTARIVEAKLPTPIVNDGVKVTEAPIKVIYTANPGRLDQGRTVPGVPARARPHARHGQRRLPDLPDLLERNGGQVDRADSSER